MKVEVYNPATGTESYEAETTEASLTLSSKVKLSFQDTATGQLVEVTLNLRNIIQLLKLIRPLIAILPKIK